jgi:hypothetical protein
MIVRRIIKRVVTTITTVTWEISWVDGSAANDAPPADPQLAIQQPGAEGLLAPDDPAKHDLSEEPDQGDTAP